MASAPGHSRPASNTAQVVQPWRFTIPAPGVPLESGASFGPVEVTYEIYGELNSERSNAILLLHAFSGDAHAAGVHSRDDRRPGWWDPMIGSGRAFDTDEYCVICSNVLGGCQGTTGPSSTDPETGTPYALRFPVITIGDMVNVQRRLIDHLEIDQLLAVVGGSMGGMQALEWAVSHPDRVRAAIILASTARASAQAIAFNAVGRNAIMSDDRWNGGDYYDGELPARGLAIARMVGHITYLSDESMHAKFGRRLQRREQYGFDFSDQFQVESYLEYKGDTFVGRFDANSYIYLSKAIDYFDLGAQYGSLDAAMARTSGRLLVVSFTSDWLYPTYQSKEIVYALMRAGKDVSYTELSCPFGHDSFLLETERQTPLLRSFLASTYVGI